tara:strand:- start:840 stop:1085 length:246 start_codon:yes stop_codon:yes gene_type:complete
LGIAQTEEPQERRNKQNKELYIMARQISRAVQRIQREESQQKFADQIETNLFWDDYKKETDKRKKIDMLAKAVKNGVVYFK